MKPYLLFLLLSFFSTAVFAQVQSEKSRSTKKSPPQESTIKIGVESFVHSGATFSVVSNTAQNVKGESSPAFRGFVGTIETIFLSRFSLGYTLGTVTRELSFLYNNTEVDSQESTAYSSLNMKAYFWKDHFRKGFKVFAGYGFSTYNTSIKHSTTESSLQGTSSSATVTLGTASVGMEYLEKWWGLRLSVGMTDGKKADSKSTEGITAIFDYQGTVIQWGGFFFF